MEGVLFNLEEMRTLKIKQYRIITKFSELGSQNYRIVTEFK